MKTLIKNANILTMNKNKDIFEKGALIIEGNKISYVGNEENLPELPENINIIDAQNGILTPGMINSHTHVPMVVFRSLGDDVPNRLKAYIFPLEKALVNEQMVYHGARYGIAEMLLGGVTTFCDYYYYEDEIAKACDEMGIRAILGESVVDFVAPDAKSPYDGLEYSKWFIDKWKNHELITATVASHAPYTNSSEKIIEASKLALEKGVPHLMHVAEMPYETEKYKTEYNMTPVEYLNSLGVINENFIGAHCIYVTENDLDIMEEKNMGINHNIGANSKGGKGVTPAPEMYRRGMRIGLGTDGAMSGNTVDIITQLSLVGKIHKLHNSDRSIFPAVEIFEMATMGGARSLGLEEKVGSLEVGKSADIVLIETESVNMTPIYDYYSTIVYAANPGNVESVWVNGQQLVGNKKLIKSDFKEIKSELIKIQDDIKERIKMLNL